ncbi:hypothetical protein [Pseudomonas sp. 8 R 14]|nr:hypothetical protein [Pseudomonas sp. 8 R 14]
MSELGDEWLLIRFSREETPMVPSNPRPPRKPARRSCWQLD